MGYTLDTVVREFMTDDLGLDAIDRRYARFLSIGISSLQELNHDNIGSIEKEVALEVNENGTVTLPHDYIDYYAIGYCNGTELIGLGLNTNLCNVAVDDCGNREMPTEYTEGYFFGSNFNDKGEDLGGVFGVGGGKSSVGEYKIYKELGYIALTNYAGSSIVLRYKADLNFTDGDVVVHPYNVEYVKAFIWDKYVAKARSYGLGEKQLAEQRLKKEKTKALQRHYSFSIREFVSAWKSGYKSSPKI